MRCRIYDTSLLEIVHIVAVERRRIDLRNLSLRTFQLNSIGLAQSKCIRSCPQKHSLRIYLIIATSTQVLASIQFCHQPILIERCISLPRCTIYSLVSYSPSKSRLGAGQAFVEKFDNGRIFNSCNGSAVYHDPAILLILILHRFSPILTCSFFSVVRDSDNKITKKRMCQS